MASKKSSSFDFFTFFLCSMALLTLLMAIVCVYTNYQLGKGIKDLKFQEENIQAIKKKLRDPRFRDLLKRKREGIIKKENTQLRVKQLINQIVNREGRLLNIQYSARDGQNNMKKETYNVRLTDLSILGLVNSLYYLEMLPGAKIENLYLECTERPRRPWESNFTVSIFSPKKGKR